MRGQIEINERKKERINEIDKGRARQSGKQRETKADEEDQQLKTTKELKAQKHLAVQIGMNLKDERESCQVREIFL